jgi:hypothetical protein
MVYLERGVYMAVRSILPQNKQKNPIEKSPASSTIVKKSDYTYPSSAFTKPSTKPAIINNWPPKLKDIEFILKYPTEKEESPIPKDLKDTVSEKGDPTVTMPSKKTTSTANITTIPDKKDTYTVSMTTLPGKSAKKDYDYPYISIAGEDKKLAKLFKSIPKN